MMTATICKNVRREFEKLPSLVGTAHPHKAEPTIQSIVEIAADLLFTPDEPVLVAAHNARTAAHRYDSALGVVKRAMEIGPQGTQIDTPKVSPVVTYSDVAEEWEKIPEVAGTPSPHSYTFGFHLSVEWLTHKAKMLARQDTRYSVLAESTIDLSTAARDFDRALEILKGTLNAAESRYQLAEHIGSRAFQTPLPELEPVFFPASG